MVDILNKREQVAVMAMQGMLSSEINENNTYSTEKLVDRSFEIADAMLDNRSATKCGFPTGKEDKQDDLS